MEAKYTIVTTRAGKVQSRWKLPTVSNIQTGWVVMTDRWSCDITTHKPFLGVDSIDFLMKDPARRERKRELGPDRLDLQIQQPSSD